MSAAWVDRLMLRAWVLIERRTLARMQRRWPEEWQHARRVCNNSLDPERVFLWDAYGKLVRGV